MEALDYNHIKRLIKDANNILITSHHNPDGDAVGSSLALYNLFLKENKNVEVIIPNSFPGFLKWMHNSERILIYNRNVKKCDKIIAEADLIFCLDYNALSRVGDMTESLTLSKAKKIMIDHHLNPASDFDYIYSVIETSSTAELVFEFINKIGLTGKLNREISECIFVGIMTDTGSFSYACNYPGTFGITSSLIELGVDVEDVHRKVYDTYSEDRMRLLGFCLSERLIVIPEYKTAYIFLSKEDLKRFKYQVGDTEGVVNYALSIENILFAALISHRSGHVRLSFRSKGDFSVNEFAKAHFEGGGHRNAAGGNSYVSIEETRKRFEGLLPLYKKQLC